MITRQMAPGRSPRPWHSASLVPSRCAIAQAKKAGKAYIDGFTVALGMGADRIIQMDADFSHPPSAIPTMLASLESCDVVVGSRYVPGGQLDERWSWWRRFLSWWANEVWPRTVLGIQDARYHGRLQMLAQRHVAAALASTASVRTAMLSRSRWPS